MDKKFNLDGINIEVTSACPLRCPQCYCSLEGGRHIDIKRVFKILDEASDIGISHVEFSGGETLCYPYIYDAIKYASKLGILTGISISGWGFDKTVLERLVESGLDSIHVSLNATTPEKNSLTRDGFDLSIKALELLSDGGFEATTINWVMHRSTDDELQNMVAFAERYKVASILVLDPKPNSKNELLTYPTKDQLIGAAHLIKNNKSNVDIEVHHCFSVLAALVGENKLWGNLNRGVYRGCTAGICSISVDVDGNFIPCRHLECHEKFDSLNEYWQNSKILNNIRDIYESSEFPCSSCKFTKYCRHCLAINNKINNRLYYGNEFCPIYNNE